MSLITKGYRVSVQQFATVPPLLNLPEIPRLPGSVSSASSLQNSESGGFGTDLAEGCTVTKSIKYTHRYMHFIQAAHYDEGESSSIEVERLIDELRIMTDKFEFCHPGNVIYLEEFVHTSLNIYAFIAVTASTSTLDGFLKIVQSENQRQQQLMDETGSHYRRELDFNDESFLNPEFELVALHPEHFLPCGSKLTLYDHSSSTSRDYVAASDRCIRESVDPTSPRFPPFHHFIKNRQIQVNVFLVILNAQIKFRRYVEMIRLNPPTTPLPDDVMELIHRTIELVDLLYWKPVPAKGSKGEKFLAAERAGKYHSRRQLGAGQDEHSQSNAWVSSRTPVFPKLRHRGMDLKARVAYGNAPMGGPAYDWCFDEASGLYHDEATVEEWTKTVI